MTEKTFLRKLKNVTEKREKEDRLNGDQREDIKEKEVEVGTKGEAAPGVLKTSTSSLPLPRVAANGGGPKRPAPGPPPNSKKTDGLPLKPLPPLPTSPRSASQPQPPQQSLQQSQHMKCVQQSKKVENAMAVLKAACEEFSDALLRLLEEFGEKLSPDYKSKTRGSRIESMTSGVKQDARKLPPQEEEDLDDPDAMDNDVNIWDELQEAEGDNSIVYGIKKKRGAGAGPQVTIRAATLNRLIVRLTDESSHGTLPTLSSLTLYLTLSSYSLRSGLCQNLHHNIPIIHYP